MATKITRFVVTLGALLVPVTAFATINPVGQNAWTLWAFGNGNVVYNLLYAAKGLVSSSGYMGLVGFLGVIAIVVASTVAANNAMASKKLMAVVLGVFAFITIGLQETANVVVDDPVTNYINVVPNVPALVAIPPAVISEVGYKMTQLLEQYYNLPSDLTLSGGDGFDLANSLVNDETQVQVTSPYLRATVAAFTQNCILPALASGQLSAAALVDSTALWTMDGQTGTLSQAEQSTLTPVYTGSSPGGTVIPCGPGGVGTLANGASWPTVTSSQYPSVAANNAYQYISSYFNTASPNWMANTASTFASTSTYSWLGNELTSAEQWDFGTGLTQSTGETISQAAAVNLMSPALRSAAVASGDSPLVTSLAVAQGQQSQISSWATSAALFRDLAGYIFSVLQAFILGIAPIILAVVVVPGAGKRILLSYMQVLIWLALWEPTMSVINYIVALYAQGQLGPTLGSSGGFSMMNQSVITKMTSNMELAAGFLASTVPLITWGLVKGGLAFTDFVVGAVGSSFATTAGAMAATGNVSLGNFSMGNTTLDQSMLAAKTTAGAGQNMVDVPGEGDTYTAVHGGTTYKTPLGSMSGSVTRSNAVTTGQTEQRVSQLTHNASLAEQRAANDVSSWLSSQSSTHGDGFSAGSGASANVTTGYTEATTKAAMAGLTWAAANSANESVAKDVAARLSANMSSSQKASVGKSLEEAEGKATGKEKANYAAMLPEFSVSGTATNSVEDKASKTGSRQVSGGANLSVQHSADMKHSTAVSRTYAHALTQMYQYSQAHHMQDSDALSKAAASSWAAASMFSHAEQVSQTGTTGKQEGFADNSGSMSMLSNHPGGHQIQSVGTPGASMNQVQALNAQAASAAKTAAGLRQQAHTVAQAVHGDAALHRPPPGVDMGGRTEQHMKDKLGRNIRYLAKARNADIKGFDTLFSGTVRGQRDLAGDSRNGYRLLQANAQGHATNWKPWSTVGPGETGADVLGRAAVGGAALDAGKVVEGAAGDLLDAAEDYAG